MGKTVTVGYEYYAGMHIVACHGPVDKVMRIIVGERTAWAGAREASGSEYIDRADLFGGSEREGGVRGTVDFEFGASGQGRNSYLQGILGANVPAHRGVLGFVLRKCLLSMMNPYVKPWKFEVQRVYQTEIGDVYGWELEIAGIPAPLTDPVDVITEGFESGVGGYGLIQGNGALVTAQADAYGQCLQFAATTSATQTIVRKAIGPVDPGRLSVKFKIVTGTASDDTAAVELMDSGLVSRLSVIPKREGAYDALRRCRISTGGQEWYVGENNGAAACQADIWYRVTVDRLFGTGVLTTLTRLSDGVVVDTDYREVLGGGWMNGQSAAYLQFRDDAVVGSITVRYDDVIVQTQPRYVDMNPAHIIRELLQSTVFGLGYADADIDDASFTAVARTLFDEGFGLSFVWDQAGEINDMIRTVLRHIDAVLYVDPLTGLFTMKLIRGDYDINDRPIFGASEIMSVEEFSRSLPSETFNQVTVKWLDRENKTQATTATDLAGVVESGTVNTTTIDLPGIAHAALAQRVAVRELGQVSRSLVKVTAIFTRAASATKIGDVVRLTLPAYQIDDVAMRVMGISYGDFADGRIRMDLVQDVFSLPQFSATNGQGSTWAPPYSDPVDAPYRVRMEAPWRTVVIEITGNSASLQGDLTETGGSLLYGASGMPSDTVNYSILTRQGAAAFVEQGSGIPTPSGQLSASLDKTTTAITITNGYLLEQVALDTWAVVDPGTATEEIVAIKALNVGTGAATIARGILDTTPHAHSSGARLFFLENHKYLGTVDYLDAEALDIKTLPVTSGGKLAEAAATTDTYTFDARRIRPLCPGKFRMNGNEYPAAFQASLTITWAHRDRLLQTANLVEQDAASIGPEASTTYTVEIYNVDTTTVLETITGITGTSQVITPVASAFSMRIRLWAVRGGHASWQVHEHTAPYPGQLVLPVNVSLIAGNANVANEAAGVTLTVTASLIAGTAVGDTGSDPNWASVNLLMRGEESNGDTTPLDDSALNHTTAAAGGAQVSTAQAKYGTGSLQVNNSAHSIDVTRQGTEFDFGTGDFTIEAWVRTGGAATIRFICTTRNVSGGDMGWMFYIGSDHKLGFTCWDPAGTTRVTMSGTNAISSNTWTHVAVTRNGSSWKLWKDGSQEQSATNSGGIVASTNTFRIGYDPSAANRTMDGYIDELRITKGVARYTDTFTPPSAMATTGGITANGVTVTPTVSFIAGSASGS